LLVWRGNRKLLRIVRPKQAITAARGNSTVADDDFRSQLALGMANSPAHT